MRTMGPTNLYGMWRHVLVKSHGMCRTIGFAPLLLAACATMAPPERPETRGELWGFTAPWDPRSAQSVLAHQGALDAVVTGWIALDSVTLQPVVLFRDTLTMRLRAGVHPMALVTTYQGTRFHPETIRGLATDSALLGRVARDVAASAVRAGYRGIVLDMEGMTAADLPALLSVTGAIADSAHEHGLAPVAFALPATDTMAYPARPLLHALDLLVVMLYDQHWLTSPPGPIAEPAWVRRVLSIRVAEAGGAERLVAAFPTYGYQWRQDSATAVLSYDDASRLAPGLVRDTASMTLHAEGARWTIWASDAILLDSLVREARRAGVTRIALWRLGLEDPALWTRLTAARR